MLFIAIGFIEPRFSGNFSGFCHCFPLPFILGEGRSR
jgi:hypothetical protein